jgi:hypothetical protein
MIPRCPSAAGVLLSVSEILSEIKNEGNRRKYDATDFSLGLPHYRFFHTLPGWGAWVDYVEVVGASDLKQAHAFLLFARPFVFRVDVVATEIWGNHVICGSVNQPLPRLRNRKVHGVGFAIVVGNLTGRSAQKLDYRIVAEVELVRALQVDHTSE